MNTPFQTISPAVVRRNSPEERKQSPPAFLDLADSAARLGTNLPDISARVELKRLEHERHRLLQRQTFEQQMRALELPKPTDLLSIPFDPNASNSTGIQHLAVSAPTTPPRINAVLNGEIPSTSRSGLSQNVDVDVLFSKVVGSAATTSVTPTPAMISPSVEKKLVTYAPSVDTDPTTNSFARTAGAKSMPASRRTSASEHDEELASHLQNLTLAGERSLRTSPAPGPIPHAVKSAARYAAGEDVVRFETTRFDHSRHAGMLLDKQLDQEMHNAMKHLPTSDNDKFHGSYVKKLSTASALDLAPLSQTSPRTSFSNRTLDSWDKSSEWPQFAGAHRTVDTLDPRSDRRHPPNLSLPPEPPVNQLVPSAPNPSANHPSSTQSIQPVQPPSHGITPPPHFQTLSSQRASPPGVIDHRLGANTTTTTRSVPTTPLGLTNHLSNGMVPGPLLKGSTTPDVNCRLSTPGAYGLDGAPVPNNHVDLQASLSRMPYDNGGALAFGSVQGDLDESVYGLNGDPGRFSSYSFDPNARAANNNAGGPGAHYHPNGAGPGRYGLALQPPRSNSGIENKMNGLHGPKHKRGDMDREFNRFSGTRLEDLKSDILSLCKDQHGCRYLQKKLEEGVPEHRDMIFNETFGHFSDLMTDPFGNYLCQKLLEFSTDEQRSVICDSVAQDLVNISLNMHGTRAVQKMIDFLSSRRQADHRYNAQIHSIIVALSLHVVILIKDLNGNHVIQKCLNKLTSEDNQFIYNAVAANCVEVATHRHGCCVLQRCIDHAADHQRIQLVNEITYHALTLVQDPYGNYVVQYILDLNDNRFSDAVIRQFLGNVCALSVQKFSSNVIEKCIRVAEHNMRKMLIEELLNRTRLEKLLRDSYGNYCVQTALDYAEPSQRALLVEGIRPVLPLIRNTPYGKRIQNKLQRENLDHFVGGMSGYHTQQGHVLGNQGMGMSHGPHGSNRHVMPNHQGNPLTDVYGAQNALYSHHTPAPLDNPGSFSHGHLGTPLQGHPPLQGIDSYVLQNSAHNPHGGGFSNVSTFAAGPFGNATGSLDDPYQRSSFGYGI